MRINVRHIELANLAADEVEKFTLNIQNREIKPSAVKKVIKEVYDQESGTWNQVNPIQVNLLTGNVVEGQHRREGYPQNGHIIIPLDPDIEWHGIKKWWIGKEDYTVNGVKVRITTEEFFDICNNHNGVKIRITDKEKFDKYNKK